MFIRQDGDPFPKWKRNLRACSRCSQSGITSERSGAGCIKRDTEEERIAEDKEVKKPEPFEVNRRKEEVQKVDQQGQGVQQQVEKQRQAVQQQIEKPSHPVKKTLTASESSKIQRNRLMQA